MPQYLPRALEDTIVTNDDIVKLLIKHRTLKNQLRKSRIELLKVVVSECGVPRDEAAKLSVEDLLDGYLIGHGVIQQHRETD